MPFRTVNELATAQSESGKFWQSFIYKSTQPAVTAGFYADSSVGSGTPSYNAYVGGQYEFTQLIGSANKSIYAGPDVSTNKYISEVELATFTAGPPAYYVFADYLGFYPLVDGDSLDLQEMVNVQTLPRYTTGDGVLAFMVTQTPGDTSNANATMTYTNQSGVSGRSTTFGVRSQPLIGGLLNQGTSSSTSVSNSSFITLANGDTGIRSIQNVTFSASIACFVNIVLCKPLFALQLFEQGTSAEKTFFKETGSLPRVLPGAFLQFLSLRGTFTNPAPLRGRVNFVWE